jgi:hypothetical protein
MSKDCVNAKRIGLIGWTVLGALCGCALHVLFAFSPSAVAGSPKRSDQISRRLDQVNARIERLEDQYIHALGEVNKFAAMGAPFHNLNPAQAYRLYGGPFPQVTVSGPNVNEIQPVVKLSPASPRYGRIVGNYAGARSRLMVLDQRLAELKQEKESLQHELDYGDNPPGNPPAPAKKKK